MVAVKLKENMDFDSRAIYQHVKNYLPSYARPRFIRIQVMTYWPSTCEVNKIRPPFKHTTTDLFLPLAGHSGGDRDI